MSRDPGFPYREHRLMQLRCFPLFPLLNSCRSLRLRMRMWRIDAAVEFCFLLVIIGLVNASSNRNSFGYCESVVKKWAYSSLQREAGEDKHALKDLLFFLHVPRTGGRTYFQCFLKKLYPGFMECPRSYDKLHFNPSETKCRLLVTHDDYSMMPKLTEDRTSVVTILRDPVDRVFSTYEFSIEVAARFMVHPNLKSATRMAGRLRSKSKGVSTLDIWPWKYLVPWMRADLFARRDVRFHKGLNNVESNDSYNMEEIAMPLHDYINHPVAEDIIHNGATFQVAGLTNNSYLPESHEVRHCVQKYRVLGEYVLQVAKKRLDNMLYVGLTEKHKESATVFANVVGAQVMSQLRAPNSSVVRAVDNTDHSSFSDPEPETNEGQSIGVSNATDTAAAIDNGRSVEAIMTVEKLMEAYGSCISGLRKSQSRRRTASLKRIAPVNFSKEARIEVENMVIQQIRSLNNLDMDLYAYATHIFANQYKIRMQKINMDGSENGSSIINRIPHWSVFSLLICVLLVLLCFLFLVKMSKTRMKEKL